MVGYGDLVSNLFKGDGDLLSKFNSYNNNSKLEDVLKKRNEAQQEYADAVGESIDDDPSLKKSVFKSLNSQNAINEFRRINHKYKQTLEKYIAEKKINDSISKQAGIGDVNNGILKKEVDNLVMLNSDLKNANKTNNRKIEYEIHYLERVKKYRKTFLAIYYVLVFVFLLLMFKKQKYKEAKFWVFFIIICLYPYFINFIMLKLINGLKFFFYNFTPVNAYRNLYDQNINNRTDSLEDITFHYSYLSPNIEDGINKGASDKLNDQLEKINNQKIKIKSLESDIQAKNNEINTLSM